MDFAEFRISVWAFVSVRGAAFDIRISDLYRRRTGTVNLLKSFCCHGVGAELRGVVD